MNLKKIYNSSPSFVQNITKRVYSKFKKPIWTNLEFLKWYNFLQESQWWSKKKLEEYQMQQLNKLLNHAYENVPYYTKIFNERELKPKDIQNFNDLKKLPYLTKEIIQKNLPDLIARNYPKSKLQYVTTGGSTGIPMGFYLEKNISTAREWAFMLTQWNRVGYNFGNKSIILRGNVIQSVNKNKFWEINPITKNLILSSYHLTDENLPKYIKKIREFGPAFIQAYPSAITILAKFMEENNIKCFNNVKAILCGSENIYKPQRSLLEDVFKCRVYSWYGHSERVVLAGECEKNSYYHIYPEYGFVELIGQNRNPVTKDDEKGEIVATGLNNFACPFIRYRTSDIGIYTSGKCSCGRNYPLLKRIEGRLQELIITKDKKLITLTALIFAQHFEAFSKIKEMQLIQEKEGELVVKIVKTSQYSKNDECEMFTKIQKTIGKSLDITFNYVNFIPRAKNGKYRFLIQKLPIKSDYE